MKYYANMSVNSGTRLMTDLVDTNKKRLAQAISECARGNCYDGNEYSWRVVDEDSIVVAAGAGMKQNGKFIRFDVSDIIGTRD